MLSKEEISIRLGIDSKAVYSAMATMSSKMKQWAGDIRAQIIGGFAFGVVINQIKETIDYVERLANRAGSLGISQSFLQDLENVGKAAGKSSEDIEKMITVFARGLSPGQDVKKEFEKFLDSLNAIQDPVQRAQAAFERLGKSGITLLDFANSGSKAFNELANSFAKLSDSEIKSILKFDDFIDQSKNKFMVYAGKLLAFFDKLVEARSVQMESGSWITEALDTVQQELIIAENLEKLKKQQAEHEAKILEAKKLALEVSKNEADYQLTISKRIAENAAKIKTTQESRGSKIRSFSDVSMSEAERQSIEKFGDVSALNFSDKQLGDVNTARQLDQQSRQARIDGNASLADQLQIKRQALIGKMGFLSDDQRDPLSKIDAELKALNLNNTNLLELAKAGLPVSIVKIKEK